LETALVQSNDVYTQIIAVAKKKKCDLICMASHGRRGLGGILLGSETHKVLTHSKVPVLVLR
jgi:nucleotide-binding universal stress UspA family protein